MLAPVIAAISVYSSSSTYFNTNASRSRGSSVSTAVVTRCDSSRVTTGRSSTASRNETFVVGEAPFAAAPTGRRGPALIDENREQPDTEHATAIESIEGAKGTKEDVLDDVLGIGVVSQHAARDARTRAIVSLDERRIRVDVPIHRARHEIFISHSYRCTTARSPAGSHRRRHVTRAWAARYCSTSVREIQTCGGENANYTNDRGPGPVHGWYRRGLQRQRAASARRTEGIVGIDRRQRRERTRPVTRRRIRAITRRRPTAAGTHTADPAHTVPERGARSNRRSIRATSSESSRAWARIRIRRNYEEVAGATVILSTLGRLRRRNRRQRVGTRQSRRPTAASRSGAIQARRATRLNVTPPAGSPFAAKAWAFRSRQTLRRTSSMSVWLNRK